MVQELQEALGKGGTEYKMEQINTTAAINIVESSESLDNTIDTNSYAKAEDDKKPEDKKNSEPEEKEEDSKSEPAEDEKEKKNETKHECKDEKKYNLDEVTEYAELKEKFDALTSEYAQLEATVSALQAEISPLKEFKLAKEHDDKQNMINSFYMLSDEDKADVQANIDNYSLDDIEAKLSIACVRNRVNFSQEEEEKPGVTFSLSEVEQDSAIPAWIQAVKDTESKMN
jgi:chromosome segregation ATPase